MELPKSSKPQPVLAHYMALMDKHKRLVDGSVVKLDPPAVITVSEPVDDKMSVHIQMSEPVTYEIVDPSVVGFVLLTREHRPLLMHSLPPRVNEGQEVTFNTRYIMLEARTRMS